MLSAVGALSEEDIDRYELVAIRTIDRKAAGIGCLCGELAADKPAGIYLKRSKVTHLESGGGRESGEYVDEYQNREHSHLRPPMERRWPSTVVSSHARE